MIRQSKLELQEFVWAIVENNPVLNYLPILNTRFYWKPLASSTLIFSQDDLIMCFVAVKDDNSEQPG